MAQDKTVPTPSVAPEQRLNEAVLAYLEETQAAGRPPEPAAFLARYPDLREELADFLAGQAEVAAMLAPWAGRPGPAPAVPATFGRYAVDGEINRGGMGVILRARDRALHRDVAVKVLHPNHAGRPEIVRRFIEEAQIGSQLEHPGIPPVHELGTLPDGRPFFTLKLVKGRDLAALLRERPDPAHERAHFLGIFHQVCDTVAYAHSKNVLHRDLKPANIMVGAFGEVQVMDWGLGKVLARAVPPGGEPPAPAAAPASAVETVRTGEPDSATQAGSALGTYAYMPPEQAQGRAEAVDRRCDVFGLGAVLCEVLTGEPPYTGPTFEVVKLRAVTADLAPPFARLDACGADAELVALTRSCLAADPAARPKDAEAVAAAVGVYLDGVQSRLRQAEVAQARAETRADEERKRRRVQLGLAVAALLLVAGAGAAGVWYKHDRHLRAIERGDRQALAAREEAALEADVRGALDEVTAFQQGARWADARAALERAEGRLGGSTAGPLTERVARARAELDLVTTLEAIHLQRAAAQLGGLAGPAFGPAPDPAVYYRRYADALRGFGLDVEAGDPAALAERVRASGIRPQLVAALEDCSFAAPDDVGRSRLLTAARLADPDEWRDQVRAALAARDRPALRGLADRADVDRLAPSVLVFLGETLADVDQEAAERFLRRVQAGHPADFRVNLALGGCLLNRRDDAAAGEALPFFRAALVGRPDDVITPSLIGYCLLRSGKPAEAEPVLARVAARSESPLAQGVWVQALLALGRTAEAEAACRRLAQAQPESAEAADFLASVLVAAGKPGEAEPLLLQALDRQPGLAAAHAHLASVLALRREWDRAEAECREALRLDPDLALAHNNLSVCCFNTGRLKEAEDAARRAVELEPALVEAEGNLANCLAARGRLLEAEARYRHALGQRPDLAAALGNLGFILLLEGRAAEGEAAIRRALELQPGPGELQAYLGLALVQRGELAEGEAALRDAVEALPPRNLLTVMLKGYANWAMIFQRVEGRLPALLGAELESADPGELLGAAELCLLRRRPADAVRLYREALRRRPESARAEPFLSFPKRHLLLAGRAAVLAAVAATEAESPAYRRQALEWLEADFAGVTALVEKGSRRQAAVVLLFLQNDPALAGVRDEAAFAKLPAEERAAWRRYWADVAYLAKQAGG
jgi:serine/threonine-protein kinase